VYRRTSSFSLLLSRVHVAEATSSCLVPCDSGEGHGSCERMDSLRSLWRRFGMALCQCTVRNSDSDMEGCTFTGAGLRVFMYWSNGKEHYVSFTQSVATAEEICIHVAQRLG
ncbi:hypothetical protein GDO81_023819, partial [Engystomops pustulosus]